jgi:hypothetical protein
MVLLRRTNQYLDLGWGNRDLRQHLLHRLAGIPTKIVDLADFNAVIEPLIHQSINRNSETGLGLIKPIQNNMGRLNIFHKAIHRPMDPGHTGLNKCIVELNGTLHSHKLLKNR